MNLIKSIYKKNHSYDERLNAFPSTSEIWQRYLFSPLIQITLEVLASTTGRKEKAYKFEKEKIKLSLCADDMIFYVENLNESIRNPNS